ncbi:MAG: beta-lactamase family protein, partial [Bacteroidetes bacterium]|nr:beta-lactamase family protein [Bacteroidota bacterium]
FGSLLRSPKFDPDAAIFLAGLAELDPRTNGSVTPRMMDRLWWTKFKAGSSATFHKIIPFPATASSGTILREKAAITSPFTHADAQSIRAVSREWTSRSKEPMVVSIAHRGTVVFHESFGTSADGQPIEPAAPMWMASITKLLTGVLVMQFADRGLVELDAPIDRYLPELASARPCPLTIRMLLNHTAGLSWAGEWASDWEPSMENRVAHALPFLQTGKRFRYHRGGYALTSKILERISGETVPQLFQRMIFQPLELQSAFADNTYGGLYCSALDLARFGHMLLQHGRSGTQTIITDSAFTAMLPIPLTLADGERARSWGVGTSALGGNGLSASTFGHEAASGAIFRIDPVNDLVVVVARNRPGTDDATYKEFAGRFLQAVTAPIHRVPESHRE